MSASAGTTPDILFRGSCQCGYITYASTVFPESAGTCHCITCQKLSGSPFMSFVPVPASELSWTNDCSILYHSDIAKRMGCPKCHSWLAMIYHSTSARVSLNISSVDFNKMNAQDIARFVPSHHIFVSQKAKWFEIQDGKPQYERFRGDSHRKET